MNILWLTEIESSGNAVRVFNLDEKYNVSLFYVK